MGRSKTIINNNNPSKTVGRQTAKLLSGLYDRRRPTFGLADVEEITGLKPSSARSLIDKATRRGLVTRVKAGLFTIIPPELGSGSEYAGNPYMIARQLAGSASCFISHGSAMEIHRMVTQPQFVVFASSPKRIPHRVLQGTEFRFVFIKQEHVFGTGRHWVSKQESVDVSDLERTIIDGLRHPAYCGGLTEVVRGLWMRRKDIDVTKLIDYGLRLGVGAVFRRLGYVLEATEMATPSQLQRLQKELTASYVPLDPLMPREGAHLARWRLLVNIPPQELDTIRES